MSLEITLVQLTRQVFSLLLCCIHNPRLNTLIAVDKIYVMKSQENISEQDCYSQLLVTNEFVIKF
jgi:hypothetical protein